MAGQPNTPDVPPYNLRLATEQDIDVIVEMGARFYAESPLPAFAEWDEDSAATYIFSIIDNGLFILCETSDTQEVVGMLALLYTPFPYNSEKLMATECAFWIDPEHRGLHLAKAMKEVAETCAEEEGCSILSFMTLSTSPPQAEALYKEAGFQPVEVSYLKAL